ncbi:MAG TPA: type II toxin-antitoxin system HicB family antitoxin [Polyangia bacterium]|nr:type II toxin-antitoxin system HicB family antitoxin [Polyangia bacterium]
MKFYNFEVVIEKEDEGNYSAYSPTLPGCFSNGRTVEEAKQNIREAILLHLEALREKSSDVPQAGRSFHVEEISVGLP